MAMRAKHPHQALRHDAVQGRDKGVGVHRHVLKAAQHVKHIVGVHGREHQVAGERRLHGNLGGFGVADFADHDLVGVVPQNGAQAQRKGQALAFIDRDLQHAGHLVFHRVFNGDDLAGPVVDLGDGGVQRGGFAAAGGAGNEQHAVRLAGQAADDGHGCGIKAQVVECQTGQLVA